MTENTTAPSFMPVLSVGAHSKPEEGACVMEMVSYLAGEPWSDYPACTDRVLARVAQYVNDTLDDTNRHKILEHMPRLFGTGTGGMPMPSKIVLEMGLIDTLLTQIEQLLELGQEEQMLLRRMRISVREMIERPDLSAPIKRVVMVESSCGGDRQTASLRNACVTLHNIHEDLGFDAYGSNTFDYDVGSVLNDLLAFFVRNGGIEEAVASFVADAGESFIKHWIADRPTVQDDLLVLLGAMLDSYDRITGRTTHHVITNEEKNALVELTR